MKIKLHPLFIVYLIFLILFKQFIPILLYLICVIIHEYAHNFVSTKLGYKLDKLTIMPYGVCLNYNQNIFLPRDEFLIAIAGPLSNFIICIFLLAIWWIFPSVYTQTILFFNCNLILFSYNLLPCYPLDGGRVLCSILSMKFDRKFAKKIVLLLNKLVCIVFVLAFIIGLFFKVYNFNLLIIAFFMFVSILEPNKLSSYNFCLDKKLTKRRCGQIKFIIVDYCEYLFKIISKESKYKFNIIYVILPNNKLKVLTENELNDFCIKYSPTMKLCEIIEILN